MSPVTGQGMLQPGRGLGEMIQSSYLAYADLSASPQE